MTRDAVASDRAELHDIWMDTFDDSPGFADWFFDERFIPEYSTVETIDRRIVSCLHSYPFDVRVRNSVLRAAMVAGVATLPDFRGKGYMRRLMKFHMEKMRKRGIPISVHHPSDINLYTSLGQLPTSDSRLVTLKKSGQHDNDRYRSQYENKCFPVSFLTQAQGLFDCYTAFAKNYSGIISRSKADFELKMRDYCSDGGRCIAYERNGKITGYCVYFENENELLCDECVCLDNESYKAAFQSLAALYFDSGLPADSCLNLKCAPDSNVTLDGAEVTIAPSGVTGVSDAAALIKALNLPECGFSIEVSDDIVPGNNGVYSCTGEKSVHEPSLTLSSGHLAQWATGYKSLAELTTEGNAAINNPHCLEIFGKIPKTNCFIFDEY